MEHADMGSSPSQLRVNSAGPLLGRGFSFPAPIPPLAFFRGQSRVACLGHRGLKDIKDAGVLALASEAFETCIQFHGILFGKLGDGMNAKLIKVPQHGGTNGDEVSKTAVGSHDSPFTISLFFRYRLSQTVPHSAGFVQEVFVEMAGYEDEKRREEEL